jgi:UTP--glucose-1-phosphate uridylyltransferase
MELDWAAIEREFREAVDGLDIPLDRARIERFAAEIRAGTLGAERNRLASAPELPAPGEVDELDALAPAERARMEELGRQAFARGEVAVAVLNGGMATRFGGAVKGIVEAVGGKSFLEIKRAQLAPHPRVRLLVMNSFATHRATGRFIEKHRLSAQVDTFLQGASLRLTPEGELFRDEQGGLSAYAPGHGDFSEALAASGLLARLRAEGVRAITLSNVDNLGADPDPLVLGYHLARGRDLTVEVARTIPGDVGGAPARVDGRLQIVEGFRFPRGFDFDRLPFVNTNTFVFSADALARRYPLSWFYVEKKVGARVAVQMERLVGEISSFAPASYLCVPRSGPRARYYPVKTPEDLAALRADPVLVRRFLR